MKKFTLRTFKVLALVLTIASVMLSSMGIALAGAAAPNATASFTHRSEFISEKQAKDAYTWVAKNIFRLKVNKHNLKAEFDGTLPHPQWHVSTRDNDCYIDAVTGDVLMFYSSYDKQYCGEKITLWQFDNDPAYSYKTFEDPNNPYSKLAAEIVKSKLAKGRMIDEVMIDGVQFVWDNNGEGFDPNAKGTIQVDAKVLMPSGRSYCLSFWGTKQLELKIFSSHPTKDACLWGYFYPEDGEDYPPVYGDNGWKTAPGITDGKYAVNGSRH